MGPVTIAAYAGPGTEDVILRDGSTLRLRAAGPEDADALVEFFAGLSSESRYLRFQGAVAVGVDTVRRFVGDDWSDVGSLVAERSAGGVAPASWRWRRSRGCAIRT